MGDPKNPNPSPFSLLPPGCRFFPSDEQLICCYLTNKNNNDDHRFGFDVIKEIDLYNFDPFDFPGTACFRFGRGGRKRHYYCYVARVSREEGRRRAGGGYWKRCGRVRDVVGGGAGKDVVGRRKSFVFYLGDSPKSARRTDWVMDEYALIEHHLASFVLCRVFVKSRRNNRSDHPLSSCGEDSVATVRHIGVQHDGINNLVTGETNKVDNKSLDHKNKVSRFSVGLLSELDDGVTSGPGGLQMSSSGLSSGREMIVDSLTAQQLVAILEEDFIELDDLVFPLPAID